jgi:hypothetical protein
MKRWKRVARKDARKVVGGHGTSPFYKLVPPHCPPPPWRPKKSEFMGSL